MKFWHNGVLTPDIDKTIDFLCATSGSTREKWTIFEVEFPQEKMTAGDGGKLRVAFARVGDIVIELLQPLDELSYHAKALAKRGPGFHHNAYIYDSGMDDIINALLAEGGRKVWEFRDGNDHSCYVEAAGGNLVLELNNHCPFMPE